MRLFLGVDVGGTKTHAVISDETGNAVGFGRSGAGNHEVVGYAGLTQALIDAIGEAVGMVEGVSLNEIAGGGFGVAGYDWPYEKPMTEEAIRKAGVNFPIGVVNDTIIGLVAGSEEGWGVGLVSGTGCNCRGMDKTHQREAYVTGSGITMGENAGATELVYKSMQIINYAWICRIPETALTQVFIDYVGAKDEEDLIEGYCQGRYSIAAPAARLVFETAQNGDQVARDLIHWAGTELGEMACGMIRKLGFEDLAFDVVLSGSMFDGGRILIEPMEKTILRTAPKARFVNLAVPPVVGAVLIGMEEGGVVPTPEIRAKLKQSLLSVL